MIATHPNCSYLLPILCYTVQPPISYKEQSYANVIADNQGGRIWQPFVVFARNRKFANSTQSNMQYLPYNSALIAQETLFLTQKGTIFAQRSPKSA